MAGDATAPPPGLRERNKQDKERRIREAARRLLIENGFEATTLRAVAEEADVGFGTVFAYATDKAGLLAMIFVRELQALPALFDPGAQRADPLDELIAALGKLYAFWAQTPMLSRHVLQQIEFYSGNPHMAEILARRRQVREEITGWIRRLQRDGRVRPSEGPEDAAATLFAIYTSAVREWTASAVLDQNDGLATLRRLLALPMRALTSA